MDEIFITDGYCVVDHDKLCTSIDKEDIEKYVYQAALNNFYEVLQIINENKLEFGIGVKNGMLLL